MRKYNRLDVTPKNKPATKRILSVKIKRILDDSPDTSWIGEYSDTAKTEFAIDRAHSTDCAALESNHHETVDALERVISHLNDWRLACANDPNNTEWEALDEALDLCVRLQEDAAECDCGQSGDNWDRREYRYFNPGSVESFKPDASWIPAEITEPKAREKYWRDAMRQNAKQDYERMEELNHGDFSFIGVRADADIAIPCGSDSSIIQHISSGGLWGIESDSDKVYFDEVQAEQLSELKAQLKALGFSTRAIAAAFKNARKVQE